MESEASLTQSPQVADQMGPMLEPMPNVEPTTIATTDIEKVEHSESVAPEPTRTSNTLIPDPTPSEPNIMHIFDDACVALWVRLGMPCPTGVPCVGCLR